MVYHSTNLIGCALDYIGNDIPLSHGYDLFEGIVTFHIILETTQEMTLPMLSYEGWNSAREIFLQHHAHKDSPSVNSAPASCSVFTVKQDVKEELRQTLL